MHKGTIAKLAPNGYGFISREGEQKDLFFHANELVGIKFEELHPGDAVMFDIAEDHKGQHATQVRAAAANRQAANDNRQDEMRDAA